VLGDPSEKDYVTIPILSANDKRDAKRLASDVEALRAEMLMAAEQLDFEKAAQIRDEIATLTGSKPAGPAAGEVKKRAGGGRGKRRR